MGVILEGEEIEGGCTRWPKATHRGRRPPAREASVPPAGTRRRAAEQLELLVFQMLQNPKKHDLFLPTHGIYLFYESSIFHPMSSCPLSR